MRRVTEWPPQCMDIGFDCNGSGVTELIEIGSKWGNRAVLPVLLAHKVKIPHHAMLFTGKGQCFESVNAGPSFTPENDYLEAFVRGDVWIMRPDGSDAAKRAALSLTVSRYDHRIYGWLKSVLGFLVVFPVRWALRKNVPNPFRLGIICSELAGFGLKALQAICANQLNEPGAANRLWFATYADDSWDPCYLAALCLTDGSLRVLTP